MGPDSAVAGSSVEHGEVMSSVDGDALLVADISQDDAWLSMPLERAPVLAEHC